MKAGVCHYIWLELVSVGLNWIASQACESIFFLGVVVCLLPVCLLFFAQLISVPSDFFISLIIFSFPRGLPCRISLVYFPSTSSLCFITPFGLAFEWAGLSPWVTRAQQ